MRRYWILFSVPTIVLGASVWFCQSPAIVVPAAASLSCIVAGLAVVFVRGIKGLTVGQNVSLGIVMALFFGFEVFAVYLLIIQRLAVPPQPPIKLVSGLVLIAYECGLYVWLCWMQAQFAKHNEFRRELASISAALQQASAGLNRDLADILRAHQNDNPADPKGS
jgi:hypothetical protein